MYNQRPGSRLPLRDPALLARMIMRVCCASLSPCQVGTLPVVDDPSTALSAPLVSVFITPVVAGGDMSSLSPATSAGAFGNVTGFVAVEIDWLQLLSKALPTFLGSYKAVLMSTSNQEWTFAMDDAGHLTLLGTGDMHDGHPPSLPPFAPINNRPRTIPECFAPHCR